MSLSLTQDSDGLWSSKQLACASFFSFVGKKNAAKKYFFLCWSMSTDQ